MSEKQFFEINYDEIYYIIDSSRLQRKKTAFEDEEEYQEYCLENSLIGTQVVDLLNSLSEENKYLEEYCGDLEADVKLLNKENKQLKQILENLNLHEENSAVKMIDGKVFIRM